MAALLCLALAAPAAVMASEMPRPLAWVLAPAALLHGLRLARREAARPRHSLLFTANGRLLVEGTAVSGIELQWRGPLAFLSWRDAGGARRRLVWWPDTLPSRWRRELRLAVSRLPAAPERPSVAP